MCSALKEWNKKKDPGSQRESVQKRLWLHDLKEL